MTVQKNLCLRIFLSLLTNVYVSKIRMGFVIFFSYVSIQFEFIRGCYSFSLLDHFWQKHVSLCAENTPHTYTHTQLGFAKS